MLPRAGPLLTFALALLLAVQVVPHPANACATDLAKSVPCGRIYPVILISTTDNAPKQYAMKKGVQVDIPATVTYQFDAYNDGYAPVAPTDPIKISFEYPRKPAWADLKVEPESIIVDVDNPTYFTPPSDPSNPSMPYRFTTKVTIHATLTGQAVLRDGYDYAKLLVFAKSTENNLYQAAYGIKEIRVQPEGAVHESDVAGLQDKFTAEPLPPLALPDATAKSGATTVTLTAPKSAKWWEPATFQVKVSPAPGGQMLLAMHDEAGELEALAGPVGGATGTASFNATIAKPGLHTVTVTLLPDAGSPTPPVTIPLDLQVASGSKAQGYGFPKTFVADQLLTVPAPIGNTNDPTMQWERDVPFYAFDTAQSVSATLTLTTPGADPLARGLTNVQFTLLDPDGNSLGTASVDPSRPQWTNRVGSVPIDGWYTLRLRGVGAPALAQVDARVEVDYATAPQARNRADGVPDVTPALLGHGGRNLTLPLDGLGVWKPSDLTPKLDKVGAMEYQTTVVDANGTLVYASGTRNATSSFTAPAAGAYRAFVYTGPALGGTPFVPSVRAFDFVVGANGSTTASTFPIADAPWAPTSPASESLIAEYAVPILDPAAKADLKLPSGARGELAGPDGKVVDKPTAPGLYTLRVYATNAGPAASVPVAFSEQLPQPVTLAGVGAPASAKAGGAFPVPGFAVGVALLVVGGVAVAIAVARRR